MPDATARVADPPATSCSSITGDMPVIRASRWSMLGEWQKRRRMLGLISVIR